MQKKILFVCTGNTCRSPLAAALANAALDAAQLEGWRADSAGLAAQGGMPASNGSLDAAAELGLDLSAHVAKPLTPELLADADLVLTMTRGHKDILVRVALHFAGKIFTLTEFLGMDGEVADPYGGQPTVYRQTAGQLQALVSLLVEKLKAC